MDITVRPALREELPRVNELREAVNRLHCEGRPDIFRPGFSEAIRERAAAVLASDQGDVLVALADGQVAGYAMVEYISRPEGPYTRACAFYHVNEFGVDESFRRRGVATAMVRYMRRDAARRGFGRVELDAWAFNASAIRFYQSVGFTPYRWYFEMRAEDAP